MTNDQKQRSQITTHVLDTGNGRPGRGINVTLETKQHSGWQIVGSGTTDADGRISTLGPPRVEPGHYRICFETGDYFASQGTESFFPGVSIDFYVTNVTEHYHVPLLLSPFAYSTYRGS